MNYIFDMWPAPIVVSRDHMHVAMSTSSSNQPHLALPNAAVNSGMKVKSVKKARCFLFRRAAFRNQATTMMLALGILVGKGCEIRFICS